MYRLYAFLFVLSAAFCGTLSAASFPVQVQAGSKTFNCVTDTGIKWEFSSGNATLPATVLGGICAMTVMNLGTTVMTVTPTSPATINSNATPLQLWQYMSATCSWEPVNSNWSCDPPPSATYAPSCPSDGTTDSTACFNAASIFLHVVVPPASVCYYLNGSINLSSGSHFEGLQTFSGGSNAQFCQHSLTAHTFFASAATNGARNITIENLQLTQIGTPTFGDAIHMDGNGATSANSNASVTLRNIFGTGFYGGLWLGGIITSKVEGVRFSSCIRYGAFVTGTQENTSTTFDHTYMDAPGQGCYRIHSASYVAFIAPACDQQGVSGDAYHFQPGQTSGLTVSSASWAASVVTFTLNTSPNSEFVVGEQFAVAGVTPSGYNGNDYIALSVSGAVVTAALASNPGAYSSGGSFVWGNNIRGVHMVSAGNEHPSGHGMYLDGEEFEITGGALSSTAGFSGIYINGANSVKVSNSVRINGGDYCVTIATTPTHNFPVWYWSNVIDHPFCISYGTAMFNDPNRLMQIPQKVQAGADVATTADLGTITYSNTAGGAGGYGATITNGGSQVAFAADGVTVPLYGRVLVKNQTSTFQNGLYRLTATGSGSTNWVLTRDPNWSTAQDMYNAAMIPVRLGTTNANTAWLPLGNPTNIGTDAITFGGPH